MIALASPPCHECGAAVQRLDARCRRDEDGEWHPGPWYMICAAGHRVLVEPFD
jgi:hypothetical protein